MTGRTARAYHDRTKHSVGSLGGRDLDWDNQPLPYKLYPQIEPIDLPVDWPEPQVPAVTVLSGAGPADGDGAVDLAGLARLLFLSAGVTRRIRHGAQELFFRAAPSAGGLYPIEVYVVCADLPGLGAGVYHFEPLEFALRRLRRADVRRNLAAAAADETVARRPVSLVLTGIPWRTTWKYGARGYRHLLWDAGTILSHTLTAAAATALPAQVLTGFVDAEVTRLVGVGEAVAPFVEYPLAVVALGAPEMEASGPVDVADLDLQVAPLSQRMTPEPALRAVHRAGDLGDPRAVAAWRAALADLPPQPAPRDVTASDDAMPTGDVAAPDDVEATVDVAEPDDAEATVDEVVLRRGSTRRFARGAAPASALTWGMAAAARPVPADFAAGQASLLTHLIAVHAVDGVEPGAYRWTLDGAVQQRAGDLPDETAHLCLDQALGGTSAFTVFHAAELGPLLEAGGARAYRAAQLEAGIVAGRLQLAGFALGLGGTGLTFYDDEVSRFFDTAAEPMLATAIGHPDYDARRGRRPSEMPPLRSVG